MLFLLALWVCRPPGIDFGVWFEARTKVRVIPEGDSITPAPFTEQALPSPPTGRAACPQSRDGAYGSVSEPCPAPSSSLSISAQLLLL